MATTRKPTGTRSRARAYPAKKGSGDAYYVYTLFAVCLIAGVILGAILYKQLTKEDGFNLIGEQTVTLTVGSDGAYTDPGATLVRFGRDRSDQIVIETNLTKSGDGYVVDTSAPGSYYISYTTDMRGYSGRKLIRTIRVAEDETTEGS